MDDIYFYSIVITAVIVITALMIYMVLATLKRKKERDRLINLLLPPLSDRLSTHIALNKFENKDGFFELMRCKIKRYRDQLENKENYLCSRALFQECGRFFDIGETTETENRNENNAISESLSEKQNIQKNTIQKKETVHLKLDLKVDMDKKFEILRFLVREKLSKKLYFYLFFKIFLYCLILDREKFFDFAFYNDVVIKIKKLELGEIFSVHDVTDEDIKEDFLDIAEKEFYILQRLVNKKKKK